MELERSAVIIMGAIRYTMHGCRDVLKKKRVQRKEGHHMKGARIAQQTVLRSTSFLT